MNLARRLTAVLPRLASLVALVALAAGEPQARACTTFCARTPGGVLVAKNFDWDTGEGWIVANERGRERHKLVPGGPRETASWTALFASLSFSTLGPGFPISGMNEAGLTIESLVDTSVTASTTPDPDRLTGLELVQYGLDRFDSTADLAAFAERSGLSQLAVPLHFFACDRSGACVVIESTASGVHATRGADLRVLALANRPFRVDVDAQLRPPPSRIGALLGLGRGEPHGSGERFAAVARDLSAGRPQDVGEAFHLLDRVRIPGLTKWQIVWDVESGTVHYRDRVGAPTLSMSIDAARVSCEGSRGGRRGADPVSRPLGAPRVHALGRAGRGVDGESEQSSARSTPDDGTAFVPWSEEDAIRAERAILAQVRSRSPSARRLASAVAAATLAADGSH